MTPFPYITTNCQLQTYSQHNVTGIESVFNLAMATSAPPFHGRPQATLCMQLHFSQYSISHMSEVACTKRKAPLVPLKFNREWEITLNIHTTIIFDSYQQLVYVSICDLLLYLATRPFPAPLKQLPPNTHAYIAGLCNITPHPNIPINYNQSTTIVCPS